MQIEEKREELFYVAPAEAPPPRRPPVTQVGALGWARENLFSSPLNTLATIVTVLGVAWFLWVVLSWAIQSAEWNVINTNLRLLMVGQYDPEEIWRIEVLGLFLVFLSGLGLGLWSRPTRPFFLTVIISILVIVLVPLGAQPLPEPAIRLIVPPTDFVGPMQFVGEPGQTVSFEVSQVTNEQVSAEGSPFNGYIENTPGLSNSRTILNDLRTQLRLEQVDLAEYDMVMTVRLLAATGESLGSVTSEPGDINVSFEVELPEQGWYTLEILRDDETTTAGYAWVEMNGVSTFTTQPAQIEARIERYGPVPEYECPNDTDCTREVALRDLRYEGERTVSEYVKVQITPFLQAISQPIFVGLAVALFGGVIGFGASRQSPDLQKLASRLTVVGWVMLFPIGWYVLAGFSNSEVLPQVPTSVWGGLMLTLVLTFVSIAASFPIGILLALGRRSDLPVISVFCSAFIELVRGVPLITILFFAKLIVPFFAENLTDLDQVIRMMIGLTLFTAAYQAEVIRGGLQIVPKGQVEASMALGLNPVQTTTFIVMPQALRAVIPAIMSQFVSLFKDTTLVSIVGLFELLGIIDFIVNGQQQFRTFQREAYLFVGIIYFLISGIMSAVSRRLEESGSGSTRKL